MERRCDGSEVLESSLLERKESDVGRRLEKMESQITQTASGSAQKITEPETGEAKDQRTDGSDLQSAENSIMNPDCVFPLDELSAAEERSLGVSQENAFCPEAPNVAPGDAVFLDYPGGEAPSCKQKTDLQLQPPYDRTDGERRASSRSSEQNIYSSVLHQLLQQQKHKPGRKHKKKTLMKMAKLLVVAKGWDRRENQSLSLEEESDLKKEIFTSRRKKRAPENLKTPINISQPSHLHPDGQKEPREISSESVREETKIPPESREPTENPTSKGREKGTKAPEAGVRKKDETSAESDFNQMSKEEKPQTDSTGKDSELRFKKKPGWKRIEKGMMVEPIETERLSVSPGRKPKKKRDSVTHLEPAAEEKAGLSSLSGSSVSPGKIPAQETQSQDSKKIPRKGRNPSAQQLLIGGHPLPEQNQTKLEGNISSPDFFPQSSHGKPGKRGEKTKTPPSSPFVWNQLPSAVTSNFQNETGKKDSNMEQKRAAPKGKCTETFPVKEETADWNVMRGTFGQKQDEGLIRSWKKPKGRGQRRKKITEQTLTYQIKTEPVWEAPTNQPGFPLMDTKSANPSMENQPKRRGRPRKRKHVEDDDASQSAEVTIPGAAGDEAGGDVESFLSPVFTSSEKSGSRTKENPELHILDEPDEGLKCGKIRRSCTLGIKKSSEAEEWLIRYLKGSRRRPSKGSNGKMEGNPEMNPEGAELVLGSGGKLKQTKRGRKKNVRLSAGGEAVPGNVARIRKNAKLELATEFEEGGLCFPIHPASASGSNQLEEVTMRSKEGNDVPASVGRTGAAPESSEPKVNVRGKMDRLQMEGMSALNDDSLEVDSKMAATKMRRGPKQRRISKKHSITEPKTLESDEKHPLEGDPGAPEDGTTSNIRRGRKKKVFTGKMEDGASAQDRSSWMDSGGPTGLTPEPLESNRMNLLQIEGTSDLNDDFLGANSNVGTTGKKRGPKRRRVLKKAGPKILKSDEKHPQEGDPGAPEDGKTSKIRRGRKKKVFTVKMQEEASCFMEMEKSQLISSFQDKSNTTGSGGETGATPEPLESNRMNLLQIEGTSDLNDYFLGANSKMGTTGKKRGPKRRRVLKKAGPKILESDEKHPQEGDPGAPEDGKTPNMRRGRKKKVFTVKMQEEASCFMEMEKSQLMSSFQDKSNTTGLGGETGATPEPLESNRMNLLQVEGTSDLNDDFLGANAKMGTTGKKRGPKRRRVLKKAGPKILKCDEKHPLEGDPGAPTDGTTSNIRRGRKKTVFTVKMEDGASAQDRSSWMDSEGPTGATPEPLESNRMNLLQIEGTSDLKGDSLEVDSKMPATKMRRGPKQRRILKKHSITEPKMLESDEKHPQEGDPGAPEDGTTPNVRRGRKKKVFTVKMQEEASCFMEMEKSQLMSSFQDKSNTTGLGGETGATPELPGKMNPLETEGIPADPEDDAVKGSSKIWKRKRRQTLQKDSAGHEILESNEDLSNERDPGAPEDGNICKTSNIRRGRKKKVFTVNMEDGASVQDKSSWMDSGGPTGATPEPLESSRMNLLQIEGMSDLNDDFLGANSNVGTTGNKRGPKRRRVLKKAGPKILKCDEKHPQEGDPGAPEDGKTSNIKRGRKKKVFTVKMEEEASVHDRSSWMDSGGPTGATPEPLESSRMNLLQIEGMSDLNDDFLGANSNVGTTGKKRGPKRRRVLKKAGPKILKCDEKHPQEGEPGDPVEGKTPSVRRGRKKKAFIVKTEEEASCFTEMEKSQLMSSFQDKSNTTGSGGETGATPEPLESNRMNLLQVEGTSDLNNDFLGANSNVGTTGKKRGPKRRRVLKKAGPKILKSDGDPGAPEEGTTPNVRRGRKKRVFTINTEEEASFFKEMEKTPAISSHQDKSNTTGSGGPTGATPEPLESNGMNLLQIEGTSDLNDDFLGANSKMAFSNMKRGPKRKHSITEPKILESDEEHPQEGDQGAPEDGKTPNVRRGRKKKVFTVKMENGASVHDRSSWMDSGGPTEATPEPLESNRMNLLQIEGTSDLNDDFLGANSKMGTTGKKRGPKRRRVLNKAGPKILKSDEKHPQEGEPGAPEDGKTSNIRRGRKKKVFTIKTEEEASCFMELEKTPAMSSFQDKSNTTGLGGPTGADPELPEKMNPLQTEGIPADPEDDALKGSSKIWKRKQRQTLQKDSAGHEILESNEDLSNERDPGAPEDGNVCKTSNIRRGRKKKVFTVNMEDGVSCFMEMEANKESEREKQFQESVSAASRKATRKRRRRSKTHWSGDKKAKKPRACSFWDVPAFSSSCDETFNIQHGNRENRMTTNVLSGTEIAHRLQKKETKEKKNLQCSFCLRSFRHISALTLHKRLHTGRKPYGCSVCSRSFSQLSQLKLHSKVHSEPPAARCPCCDETFKDKTKLLAHLRVHLNERTGRLRGELGGNRPSRSSANQDQTFRCSVCSKEFTKKSTFEKHRRIHGKKPVSSRKTFGDPREIRGFLVSRLGDAAVATPVFFKCPLCQMIHQHWCHYILHLQSHASGRSHGCDACGQEYGLAVGTRRHCSVCCRASGEEKACGGSLKDIGKEGGASGRNDQQSLRPDAEREGMTSAFPEEQCDGKKFVSPPSSSGSSSSVIEDFDLDPPSLDSRFSSVSDPTFNQVPRFHPEPPRLSWRSWCGRRGRALTRWNKRAPRRRLAQPASRCSRCELEFHFLGSYMDHLQEHETLRARPSRPGLFSAPLGSRISSRRRQTDGLKCSTCGKVFSTPRNLRKHKLLHKGSHSHICLPCSRSFSCPSALKAHLEAHRRRLSVPRPARVEEPFLFPYPCRKCSATFSSTDLLEAHQVCHSVAGRKPENPPESILSFIPNIQRVAAPSSGPKRQLPVSNRKDLFRYPHPDRLYIVPDVSLEPPVVVSDTEEETDDSPPGKSTSAELELHLLVQSLIPEKRLTSSDSSDSESEPTPCWTNCAICTQTFADVATLHEHYRGHAGGM